MAEELDLLAEVRAAVPEAEFEVVEGARDLTLLVKPENLVHVCGHLRDQAHMDYLSMITSVDRPEYFEVVYYLYSYAYGGGPVVIKVRLPKPPAPAPAPVASEPVEGAEPVEAAAPAEVAEQPVFMPEVPSLTSLWRGADWQEREIYDMMGIIFTGHPNLKRILTWDGFVGYPLRKDFVNKMELTTEELLPTLPEPLVASNLLEKR